VVFEIDRSKAELDGVLLLGERNLKIGHPLPLRHDSMGGYRVQFIRDLLPSGLKCRAGSRIRGYGSDHDVLLIDQVEAYGGYSPGSVLKKGTGTSPQATTFGKTVS